MNYNECPITRTLEVIGGKWKPIVLHYLSEAPRRSGELGRLIPQASGKMLTQQLRELERDGIIQRKVYRQVPPKVEYLLTPLGESLRPIMIAMCDWGAANPKANGSISRRLLNVRRGRTLRGNPRLKSAV
jgi:DNA-binding HxlR family transcriptional regulator